jgi:hypothetical protein
VSRESKNARCARLAQSEAVQRHYQELNTDWQMLADQLEAVSA